MARWHLSYFGVSSFVVIELDVFIDHFIKVKASVGRVEIYLFIFDGLPETFYVNVVQGPSPAVHGDLDFMVLKNCDILLLVYWEPWSELCISGGPHWAIVSSSSSMHHSLSIEFETLQFNIFLLYT